MYLLGFVTAEQTGASPQHPQGVLQLQTSKTFEASNSKAWLDWCCDWRGCLMERADSPWHSPPSKKILLISWVLWISTCLDYFGASWLLPHNDATVATTLKPPDPSSSYRAQLLCHQDPVRPSGCSGRCDPFQPYDFVTLRSWSFVPASDSLRLHWAYDLAHDIRGSCCCQRCWKCSQTVPSPRVLLAFVKSSLLYHLVIFNCQN